VEGINLSDTGRSEHLQSAFGAKSSQENAEVYDSWAEDYERRVLSWGYATPAIVSWFFGRYVQPSDGAAVLDAGAGTGIMSDVLFPLGYYDLTAIDISERMLDFARNKESTKTCARWSWEGGWTSPTMPSSPSYLRASSPPATPHQSPLMS
jgi:predicted TPR repeat methyltransferase